MKIKPEILQLTINIEIGCTESESFDTQAAFRNEDAKVMKSYIVELIKDNLRGRFQYAAKVERVVIKSGKLL